MKTRKIFIRALPLLIAGFAVWMSGCSYVVDAIEGAIMNRSSFSIEASYSGGFVTVNWDEIGSGDTFAGYEVYRTEWADDEYSDYMLVASYYYSEPAQTTIGLGDTSYTYDVSALTGVYFYRLALIKWDEDKESKRVTDYYTGGCANWFDEPCREQNYTTYRHSQIDEISGGMRVEIP